MKKLLTTLLLVLLVTPLMAQTVSVYDNLIFGGASYDETVTFQIGAGFPLGNGIYEFNYVNVGDYGSLSTEVGVIFGSHKFYVIPLAGPEVNWLENTAQDPIVAYLVGSAGAIAGLDFSKRLGGYAVGKYKFKLENDILFQDGSIFSLGLYYRF